MIRVTRSHVGGYRQYWVKENGSDPPGIAGWTGVRDLARVEKGVREKEGEVE